VISGHRLLAGQHDARVGRILSNRVRDHLIHSQAGMQNGALRNLSAGKQAARVRRMNAQVHRSFIEQAVHTGRIDQEISPSFKIFGNWPYKSMWQRSPNPQVAVAAFDSSASRNTITITPQHWARGGFSARH